MTGRRWQVSLGMVGRLVGGSVLILGSFVVSCDKDRDTGETDTDVTTDTDDTSDTGDTGQEEGTGLAGRLGEATVSATSYAGWEEWYLIADEGDGEDLCRIHYDVTSTGEPRTDCVDSGGAPICEWAFDVILSGAVVTGKGARCDLLLGEDGQASDLDGTARSYGYAIEYIGHADVLMYYDEERWQVATFATWSETSGRLTYDWLLGFETY